VTVMLAFSSAGSRHSPSRRTLANACRSASPTRSRRWLVGPSTPPPRGECCRPRRFCVLYNSNSSRVIGAVRDLGLRYRARATSSTSKHSITSPVWIS
jgi:hypothetical protein